ncbi:glycosyltransferase family 2 protein [Acetobacter sp.]|jgi:glycosyltransferase involved in cell wall biosynthesis|uniref:glycosyltransferase family 2 protein n=1 Tax=Acetobacter sp. TaxID=440 RepID=UPI0025BC53BF|nr:glycosyltransferase family A protein [Acetobacter sp.]MCH4090611.1 glycosyltransferase family 2 protein [Acetobacter sp.]MCI1300054.1 glycosyltransferase family 2 protein [Acetobacter sp.]MCI1316472.1 glycosyltransferase family 2 protein [Acetobacter sp.]
MPKIDVLMSVFNCESYIADTLISIKKQTFSDYNLIIVDDGSSDKTGEIVKQFAINDARIRYCRQDNAGIVAALNYGLKYCSAPFIARHDGDDISYPERFEKQLAYLKANPDCVAVSSVARHIDENDIPTGFITKVKDMALVNCWSLPAIEPYIMQPFMMIRKSAFLDVGGYRNLAVAEDADLMWRLNSIGLMHILPEPLGDYRVHADSISSQSIIKGRCLAIWSQLAAISEQRRATKRPDIDFSTSLLCRINSSVSLNQMVEAAKKHLTEAELIWLRSAVSAKLLALCYYRPYEADLSDIRFILDAKVKDLIIKERPGYAAFQEAIMSAALRMVAAGRIKTALYLLPSSQWIILLGRIIFRVCFPPAIKDKIKNLLKR